MNILISIASAVMLTCIGVPADDVLMSAVFVAWVAA